MVEIGPVVRKKKILNQELLCVKFGWNLPNGSGEDDFLIVLNVFSLFRYYLSLKKGVAIHLNKLESPSPKDALRHCDSIQVEF